MCLFLYFYILYIFILYILFKMYFYYTFYLPGTLLITVVVQGNMIQSLPLLSLFLNSNLFLNT